MGSFIPIIRVSVSVVLSLLGVCIRDYKGMINATMICIIFCNQKSLGGCCFGAKQLFWFDDFSFTYSFWICVHLCSFAVKNKAYISLYILLDVKRLYMSLTHLPLNITRMISRYRDPRQLKASISLSEFLFTMKKNW